MPCANPLVKEMQKVETRCHALLEETAEALNEDVLALMLLAVQTTDLELSIRTAVKRCVFHMKHQQRMHSHQISKSSRYQSERKYKACYYVMSYSISTNLGKFFFFGSLGHSLLMLDAALSAVCEYGFLLIIF